MDRRRTCFAFAIGLVFAAALWAGQAEEYVVKDGVTYKRTTYTTMRPINETKYVDQQQTVYTPKSTTETKPATRVYQVPVTQWVAQPYLEGRWNPFVEPVVTYHYVPVTHWETRTEQYNVQATRNELVPEKKTVKVAVTRPRMVPITTITEVPVQGRPSAPLVSVNLAPGTSSGPAASTASRGDDILK